jgi:CheY-like chemotaxis protein
LRHRSNIGGATLAHAWFRPCGTLAQLRLQRVDLSTACNRREGLEKLKTDCVPCVILLDLMMPEMDGWQFRAEQLSEPELAQFPVIVLSAVPEIRQHAAKMNAAGFLSKPFLIDRLLGEVQRYC